MHDAGRSVPMQVLTLLSAAERQQIDATGRDVYRAVHHEDCGQLVRNLKAHPAGAVVLSVARCGADAPVHVASLVREFPQIPTVAILSDVSATTPGRLLALGHCGVRTLVDVRSPVGWHQLRDLLNGEAALDIERQALAQLRTDLGGTDEESWRFFEVLFAARPRATTVRGLAQRAGLLPSTFMSRFHRAGVPAPRVILAMARLVLAARLFENAGFSVADVANHLEYSSPQSFGRHIRMLLGMTAGEFRARFDGAAMLARFRGEIVLPHLEAWRTLRPLSWCAATGHRRKRSPAMT